MVETMLGMMPKALLTAVRISCALGLAFSLLMSDSQRSAKPVSSLTSRLKAVNGDAFDLGSRASNPELRLGQTLETSRHLQGASCTPIKTCKTRSCPESIGG